MDWRLKGTAPGSGRTQGAVVGWLDERFPLVQSVDAELYRRVPNYASAFYRYLGGFALIILAIEFLTGFLLGVYYVPDGAGQPAPAFTSVDYIQHTVYLGWLVRGIHFWGASLLIVVALLHMTFVFWTGGYRAPREVNWMVGGIVFLLILAFSLTGSLLPWDVNSYLARGRELSIWWGSQVLPGGGAEFIKNVLQGGPIIAPATLLRFYIAHVFLLPAVIVGLMYVHFRLVRRQGPAEPS